MSGIDPDVIVWFLLLIPSLALHEFAHAFAAYRLGDPTAKDAGRLTLNPLAHIHPFGTLLLPILLLATGGPVFGYAKPVPYDPHNFRNIRRGDLIVGVAGPIANLLLAAVGLALAWSGYLLVLVSEGAANMAYSVGYSLAQTNLVLAFFNMLPIPPLDGSSIVPQLLPDSAMPTWYRIQHYSFPILFVAMFVLPEVLSFDPIGAYLGATVYPILQFVMP